MKANRFRFRVWVVGSKKMIIEYGDSCAPFLNCKGEFHIEYENFNVTEDIIPMQSTGLCDKNGKEIFEGDIVIADDDGENFPDKYDEKKDEYVACGKYIVSWRGHYPAFDLVGLDGKPLDMEYNPFSGEAEFEVIGNIYENPDLLKEST
jgi:hypothetical protein